MNITDELQKLQTLREAGTVTEEEFNQLKARLLQGEVKTTSTSSSGMSSMNEFVHTITRSRTDAWLGGVCGGLAKKTQLPSWVWRLLFTVTGLMSIGVFVYLLCWFFIPLEKE